MYCVQVSVAGRWWLVLVMAAIMNTKMENVFIVFTPGMPKSLTLGYCKHPGGLFTELLNIGKSCTRGKTNKKTDIGYYISFMYLSFR